MREDGYFRQACEEEDVVGATADADACNYSTKKPSESETPFAPFVATTTVVYV